MPQAQNRSGTWTCPSCGATFQKTPRGKSSFDVTWRRELGKSGCKTCAAYVRRGYQEAKG